MPPSVAGLLPHYSSMEPMVRSHPYHPVITVVKVSINRISSCPNLFANSAVLFLTESHVDAKQKYFFFSNLSIKHKKMLCLSKKERCPLDIFNTSKNSLKSVTKIIGWE